MLVGESFLCISWLQWSRRLEKTCFLMVDAIGSKAEAAGVRVRVRVHVQWIALHFERICCNCASKWLSLNMCIRFVAGTCDVNLFDAHDVKTKHGSW